MITVIHPTQNEGVAFESYLQTEGYSHSFLKYQRFGIVEPKEVTLNMRIGSLVDGILSEPHKVNMSDSLYPAAKQIAYQLQQSYGDMIKVFRKQVSYHATMQYGGFELLVKGRLDFYLDNMAVIDLKVTWSKDVDALIKYMGYQNQLFGYCKMANVPKGYIMIHSVPLKKTFIREVTIGNSNEFWQDAILNFGSIASTLS